MADTPGTEALINELYERGVRHLRTAEPLPPTERLDTERLIAGLASHPRPRIRESLILLFIRRSEINTLVPRLIESLPPLAAETLAHMYTAAVYLQRFWRGALRLAMGTVAPLPNYFGGMRYGLPSEQEDFGEAGLRLLAEIMEQRTGYEWLSAYDSAIQLLLAQLRIEQPHAEEN